MEEMQLRRCRMDDEGVQETGMEARRDGKAGKAQAGERKGTCKVRRVKGTDRSGAHGGSPLKYAGQCWGCADKAAESHGCGWCSLWTKKTGRDLIKRSKSEALGWWRVLSV